MPWETRSNGRYYYRKKRRGGRVVSEYVGSGRVAELIADGDTLERMQHSMARAEERKEREAEAALDTEIDALAGRLATLTRGALLLDGCHTHHGTWRRRRP